MVVYDIVERATGKIVETYSDEEIAYKMLEMYNFNDVMSKYTNLAVQPYHIVVRKMSLLPYLWNKYITLRIW